MKNVVLLLLFLTLGAVVWGQIQSTAEGGLWYMPTTWVGGMVPGSGDLVQINGAVTAGPTTACAMLIVSPAGILMNEPGTEGELNIGEHLFNYGTIQNYAWGYNPGRLTVTLGGHLGNQGVITNYRVNFHGSLLQGIGNTGTFSPVNLTDSDASSPLVQGSDLNCPGTNIDLNGGMLQMFWEGVAYNLTLTTVGGNGSLREAVLYGGEGSTVTGVNAPVLEQVYADLDELTLQGSFTVVSLTANHLRNFADLTPPINGSGRLDVTYSLENRGTIRNHPNGGTLELHLYGDLWNYGTLSNQLLVFENSGQLLHDPAAPAISCAEFRMNGTSGGIMTFSDLRLSGCAVVFNGNFLALEAGFDLIQTGGYMASTQIIAGTGSNLTLNGLYLQDCEISGGNLQGVVDIKNTLTINDVTNYATLQNFINNNAVLMVGITMENRGTIRNHPNGGTLSLSLGNLFFNYGTVAMSQMLCGSGSEGYLWQDAAAPPLACSNLTVGAGKTLNLLSDLSVANCSINLGGGTLVLDYSETGFQLTLLGSHLLNGQLVGGAGSVLAGNAGFLSDITAAYLETTGTLFIYNTVTIGHLVNRGYIRNRDYWWGTLQVSQRLENFQDITNSFYGGGHYLEIAGDMYNYGVISLYRVWVNGLADQYLRNAGTISTSNSFQLVSELGESQWYYNGSLYYSGYAQNYSVNPTWLGVWQPFLAGVYGRTITFGAGSALGAPQNISLAPEETHLNLTWNQVPGAVYYKVYSSASPTGTYSILQNYLVDSDLTDGSVRLSLDPTQNPRFYKVTANN